MKRRNFLSLTAAFGGVGTGVPAAFAAGCRPKPVLTVAHITDVHITPGDNAVERFRKCLQEITRQPIDLFLNGGDSVMAADYHDITRDRVTELWATWDACRKDIEAYPMYGCLGNHDMWWAAPSKDDAMYGKDYVVKRLGIPHRYYSFSKSGWHFIVLDGNNEGVSLDEEQYGWLQMDLEQLPAATPVIVMSHYPILGTSPALLGGGGHRDCKRLKDLFYRHRDKVKACLGGHQHVLDRTVYDGVEYFCNGAVSGFWWGKGDKESAAPCYYQETPPGYAILKLYADGTLENRYYTPDCLLL